MMEENRKRKGNFTDVEIRKLIELYSENKNTLNAKQSKDSPAFVGLDGVDSGCLQPPEPLEEGILGKCHHKYQVNTTTNRTNSGNPFLSDFIPTPGNEAEEK
ncbi:unnamed protein product [Boreogadus saida]